MKFINPIYFITETKKKNNIGEFIKNKEHVERKVLVVVKSIRQSEFYQAKSSGLNPNITFIVRKFEYQNENKLKFKDDIYDVIRTFDIEDGLVEIICSKVNSEKSAIYDN